MVLLPLKLKYFVLQINRFVVVKENLPYKHESFSNLRYIEIISSSPILHIENLLKTAKFQIS
jgi:hypothetical protein